MTKSQKKALHNSIATSLESVFSRMDDTQMKQFILAPYKELEQEFLAGN